VTAIILLARPFLMFWGSVGVLMLCLPQLLFGRLRVLLCRGPLAFYGRISYGLYLMHISVFIFIGSFDAAMDRHGYGIAGNVAVVAMRLLVSTLVAAALWYGFESQILKLKKHF